MSRKELFLALLLFSVIEAVLFLPPVLRGDLIAGGDIQVFFAPWHQYINQELRSGHIPTWNPLILAGVPVMSNPQIALFYPPNILLRLFPLVLAFNLLILLHVLALGIGTYAFLRRQDLSELSAFLAGMVFMLSAFTVAHLYAGHFTFICTVPWLPICLLFFDRWASSGFRRTREALGLAFAFALQLLGGHWQIPYLTLEALGLFACWHAFRSFRDPGGLVNLLKPFLALSCAILGSLFLASIQILPTLELMASGARISTVGYRFATQYSLRFPLLALFLWPDLVGSPAEGTYQGPPFYWEYVGYVGLIPLALALAGVARFRRGRASYLVLLVVVSLFMALGRNTPVFWIVSKFLVGLTHFRVPARHLFLVSFGLAALAGYGLEHLRQSLKSHVRKEEGIRSILLVIVGVSLLDLLVFASPFVRGVQPSQMEAFREVARLIEQDQTWFRMVPFSVTQPNSGQIGNLFGLQRRIPTAQGYDPLISQRYRDFLEVINGGGSSLTQETCIDIMRFSSPLLAELGLKYILCLAPARLPEIEPLWASEDMKLYRKMNPLPRAMLLDQVIAVSTPGEVIEEIKSPEFDPGRSVVLEASKDLIPSSLSARGGEAKVTEDESSRVVVATESPGSAVLRLSEANFRGWSARVDGQAAPLFYADLIFRAVIVPPGSHTVEFVYHPRGAMLGALMTVLALIASGVMFQRSQRIQ